MKVYAIGWQRSILEKKVLYWVVKRVESLEVSEDLDFQKKEWLAERCGWVMLLLFLLAACAGLMGGGLFSEATVESEDPAATVTYSRIVRRQTPRFLEIQFHAQTQPRQIAITSEVLENWSIQHVTPEPKSVSSDASSTSFQFESAGTVRIEYQAEKAGRLMGEVKIGGRPGIQINQFVLP